MGLLTVARLLGHVFMAVFKLSAVAPYWTDAQRIAATKAWSRRVFALLGVRLVVRGAPPNHAGVLFAGNHVSWLDIYALLATADLRFVAKREIRDWPAIGRLAVRLGTHFITREKRGEAHTTAFAVAGLLRSGRNVCIFPEGTTTDGRALRPFHAPLFEAAAQGLTCVRPFAIRYLGSEGRLSDAAVFVGDTSIAASLWKLVQARGVTCEITFLPLIETAGMGRRALALAVEDAVKTHLGVGVDLVQPLAPRRLPTTATPGVAPS